MLLFFFFKQKTAYEMRISDWSQTCALPISITADNLKDNLWSELAKWQARSQFLASVFTWTKEKIYANEHPETWFLSARSFAKDANPEAIGRALSGLHSQFPFILLDETGEMPLSVGKAAQQIFTGNPQDALILQAGNPTSTDRKSTRMNSELQSLMRISYAVFCLTKKKTIH